MTAQSPGPIVLWLSSRYENIELAQAALAHVCRQRGIDSEMEHWIGMALREAVANAVTHGNRLDPDKRVLVKLESAGDDQTTTTFDYDSEGFLSQTTQSGSGLPAMVVFERKQ